MSLYIYFSWSTCVLKNRSKTQFLNSIQECLASRTTMERTQNPEPRYPKRSTSSRGMWNSSSLTLNFTKNEVLIPVSKHDQGTQFPSSLIEMEKAPQQTRLVSWQLNTLQFKCLLFFQCHLFYCLIDWCFIEYVESPIGWRLRSLIWVFFFYIRIETLLKFLIG